MRVIILLTTLKLLKNCAFKEAYSNGVFGVFMSNNTRGASAHYLETELASLFETERDTWRFVQSASLDGVWYWDLENPDNLWISPEYWACLGIDPATRRHSPEEFVNVVFEEDLPKILDNLERHYADPNVVYEQLVRFKHIDGSTVWVRCRGRATRDENGKAIRMLGAHNDITELKQSEQSLATLLKNREKFFARMSHEIRTPLHGMVGIAEVLQDAKLPQNVQSQLAVMLDCGKQLQHLLNDLLTLSKIDDDKFLTSIEDVSLSGIFKYVDGLFRQSALSKSLSFSLPDETASQVIVRSDQARLTQIISNLVSNAIKYTYSGGIEIKIEERDEFIDIIIQDTGEGIQDINAALSAYYQESQSAESQSDGTGLGLEIVDKLCTALDHDLNIESHVNEGTTVTVSLLRSESSHKFENKLPDKLNASDSAKLPQAVLIVDDNDINREIAYSMLEGHIAKIDMAADGKEAVSMVSAFPNYDVVLMDLNMPEKNGFDAAMEIKAITANIKPTRIIALSADAMDDTRKRCLKAGMKQHLAKPFTRANLLQTVIDPEVQCI